MADRAGASRAESRVWFLGLRFFEGSAAADYRAAWRGDPAGYWIVQTMRRHCYPAGIMGNNMLCGNNRNGKKRNDYSRACMRAHASKVHLNREILRLIPTWVTLYSDAYSIFKTRFDMATNLVAR
jgi:hypothetical protein